MNLTQCLHRNIQQRGNVIATQYQSRSVTYAEFGARVAKFAGALQQLGVREGKRVAIISHNSDRYLEYQLAVPWAGGALNPVNIRWSASEVAYSLDDSETQILLVDDAFTSLIPDLREKSRVLKHIIYVGEGNTPEGMLSYECLLKEAEPIEDVGRAGDQLAGVFYTGGTTGFPKGVMLSHANLCSSAISILAEGLVPEKCVYLHTAPMFHMADYGFGNAVFLSGGTHVVVPGFEPGVVLEAIQQQRITDTVLVPTMVQILLEYPEFDRYDLTSLKRIFYGASPMPESVLKQAMKRLPEVAFIQVYGMTELAPLATILHAEHHSNEGIESGRIRSAGRAGPLQQIKIVDENGGNLTPGQVGEVAVKGPNVMQGYWNKPGATTEALSDGWMHTGDGGYMDEEGYLYIVDRVKDMIISGGENIYSAEVENVITQHPHVAQCAVIGIPSAEWGEAVHAVVVSQSGHNPSLKDIRAHCKKLIAGYKCPRSLDLVKTLPLSGAGKILKNELRKPFWQGKDRKVS